MNSPARAVLPVVVGDLQARFREDAIALYPLEQLQGLDAQSAARCQFILGHGETFGVWETPQSLIEVMSESRRRVDLRRRLLSGLQQDLPTSERLEALLAEGVLYLTRLALLMRMGPVGLRKGVTGKPLDASTIANYLYNTCTQVVARGIERRLLIDGESCVGFASALTADDIDTFMGVRGARTELARLALLHSRGLWPDAPPLRTFEGKTTSVRGSKVLREAQAQRTPHPPLPDDYLAEMGPRVLWLIKDLGPNLITMLQKLKVLIGDQKFKKTRSVNTIIVRHSMQHDWRDRYGEPIVRPPFKLRHNSSAGRKEGPLYDECEWPPRTWESIQSLAATLQRAHLWLAMLVMAARQGEISTLKRDCVVEARDGQYYVNGKTYKATSRLGGRQKESPPPQILVFAIAQQVQLVRACEDLGRPVDGLREPSRAEVPGSHLWASLGARGGKKGRLKHLSAVLIYLANALGLDPKPGGKNIHPHRMRKTIARLAGIAVDGAQKVLMLLLGHEDVTTTLLYMQSDPAFAKEIDDVIREIRILRAEGLVEDMHAALHEVGSLLYAGHGGGGARVLSEAVQAHEDALHRLGMEWGADTARELAVLLTNNGEAARLIAPHVVCTKTAGEVGLCSQKKGGVVPGNCQVECTNHIEEASGRRDVKRIVPILVEHAEQNIAEGNWLPALSNKRQLIKELGRYDDLNERFRSDPNVQRVLGWDE